MDYAAATPVSKRAMEAQNKAAAIFGNPGAIHEGGVAAKTALEDARKQVALFLGCRAKEIIFTSGGTESNNLCILGFAHLREKEKGSLKNTHWITTEIEHPSVLECFKEIERRGGKVTYLSPNERGAIQPNALKEAIREDTIFISIGWGNNEIGVVQPLHALSKAIKEKNERAIFHTDAGQAPLYFPSIVHGLGVDLLTLDSGKLYGPRGVGGVYKKTHVNIAPLFYGGAQEHGLRPGSENVALAAGFAEAIKEGGEQRESEAKRLSSLRSFFIKEMTKAIQGSVINGDSPIMLPHIVSISIPKIDNEYVTLALDHGGVFISTKSTCLEGEADSSHVIAALRGEKWRAKNALRFSLGRETTKSDVRYAANKTVHAVKVYASLT